MVDIIIWLAIGAFIGWNLPQPAWAKAIQDKVMSIIKRK